MSLNVERSVDDPIANFTIVGDLNIETLQDIKAQAAGLLEEMGTYYAIVDIRQMESSENASLELDKLHTDTIFADPRITMVIVGQFVEKVGNFPTFSDKDAATDYIRQAIAKHASSRSQ